ncbi:hypothetical protein [Rhodoferax sp. GW822-FHT02A01]|uniref:hypothetical protein n=1 Tax=Rhodoferax sp. GW822-FHT02A01 TaxID=3141537 RepID=UPI00315D9DBB
MTRQLRGLAFIPALVFVMLAGTGGQAQERAVYKCMDATGIVVFSDKECQGRLSKLNINAPSDAEMTQQKAEHDAKVARDKALADEVEARRLAQEQVARAAQDQQSRVNRDLANKVEQDRAQKNSNVNSAPNVMQSAPTNTVPFKY